MTHGPAPRQLADDDRPSAQAAVLLLILLGLAFHLPRLHDPLGPIDQNAGDYFGPSLIAYERFGFAELRGLPTWVQPAPSIESVYPYPTHPPGLFWIMAAIGTTEAAMRLPTVIGAILASIALLLLLRPVVGKWPAFAAAACMLGTPAMAVFGQASYAPVLLALGLWTYLSTLQLRTATGGRALAWRCVQVLGCLIGPWIDWPFALYCLGLAILTVRWPPRAWLSDLIVPAITSITSLGLFFGWKRCIAAAPFVRDDIPYVSFSEIVRTPFQAEKRPPVDAFLDAANRFLTDTMSLPVLVLGTIGSIVLLMRAPKLVIALLIPAAAHNLIFASQSLVHWGHYNYFAAPLAAGIGALAAVRSRRLLPVTSAAVVVALAGSWMATISIATHNATALPHDFGRAALEATHRADRGTSGDRVCVFHNFSGHLSYYAYSEYVMNAEMTDTVVLEMMRNSKLFDPGIRYLWVKPADCRTDRKNAELGGYLERFPKERLVELEREFRALAALSKDRFEGCEVYLVTIPFARAR